MGNLQSAKVNDASVRKEVLVKPDPEKQIQAILQQALAIRDQVESFAGKASDSEYRYLDEMLTTFMIKLDDVDTGGRDGVRQARKAAVQEIQTCVTLLESKVDLQT